MGSGDRLLHLGDVEFDVRVHLQELVVRGVDFGFDVFFQIGHLDSDISMRTFPIAIPICIIPKRELRY